MLVKRLPVAIALIPSIAVVIYYGGWLLYGVITLVFCIGIYEYWHMFKRGGYAPNLPVMLIGVLLILYGRVFFGFEHTGIILTVLIMTAMTAHIIAFQKGVKTAGVDFNITLVGMIYIGWLGAYIISLSQMEEGRWWLLVILPASSLDRKSVV